LKIQAILFDLFDTLVLLEPEEIYYPRALAKLYKSLTIHGVNVAFEKFKRAYFEVRDKFYSESRTTLEEPHFNIRISQTLQKLGYDFDASDNIVAEATVAFADEFMRFVRLDEDATDVLRKLHEKYQLGLVSNFAIPECGWKLLDKYGLKQFLNVVVISGEVNRRKPSPAIFNKALTVLGVEASKTVFVGDMLDLDIKGAKSVGMKTILISRKPQKEATDTKPDMIISRLTELTSILEDS